MATGRFSQAISCKRFGARYPDLRLLSDTGLLALKRTNDETALQASEPGRKTQDWTPEQIVGRLQHENAPVRVCQETIYRFVYSKEGMKEDLWWYLPKHRPRKGRVPKKPKINPELAIAFSSGTGNRI